MSAAAKLNMKAFKKLLGVKNLSFASPEELKEVAHCLAGAVPPFGSVFGAQTYCDQSLIDQGSYINFNAGLRTRSVQMETQKYVELEKPILGEFSEGKLEKGSEEQNLVAAKWEEVTFEPIV